MADPFVAKAARGKKDDEQKMSEKKVNLPAKLLFKSRLPFYVVWQMRQDCIIFLIM